MKLPHLLATHRAPSRAHSLLDFGFLYVSYGQPLTQVSRYQANKLLFGLTGST
jgi:hypothetical protein